MQRVYTITLQHFCRRSCSFCPTLSLLGDKFTDIESFKTELDKIVEPKGNVLRLPCSSIDSLDLEPYIEVARSMGLDIELLFQAETNFSDLESLWERLSWADREKVRLTVLLPQMAKQEELDLFYNVEGLAKNVSYLIVPDQETDLLSRVKALPRFVEKKLFFGFPLKRNQNDGFLSPDEVYITLRELQDKFYDFSPKAYPYLEPALSSDVKAKYEKQVIFLQSLEPRYFREHLSEMGRFSGLRALASTWIKNKWLWPLRPFLYPILGLIWLCVDPKRSSVAGYWALERFLKFLAWTTYPILCAVEGAIEAGAVSFYWLVRRFRDLCHRTGIDTFWFTWKQTSKVYEALLEGFWLIWKGLSVLYQWGLDGFWWSWRQVSKIYESALALFWWLWKQGSKVYEAGLALFWWVWKQASVIYERYLNFFWGTIWRRIYPIRKIVYFTSYQVRTRLLKQRTE